jgi:hypothetical protein
MSCAGVEADQRVREGSTEREPREIRVVEQECKTHAAKEEAEAQEHEVRSRACQIAAQEARGKHGLRLTSFHINSSTKNAMIFDASNCESVLTSAVHSNVI